MQSLEGRTALITGASANIGRAIALRLAREGANIMATTCSNHVGLSDTVSDIRALGVKACEFIADVTKFGDVESLVATTISKFESLDILVNNAVTRCPGSILEMDFEDWQNNIAVNLTGPFLLCRESIPYMQDRHWGRIINFSGIAAYLGHGPAKAMAKQGIVGFTRALAHDHGSDGITANCIAPGLVDLPRRANEPRKPCYLRDDQAIARLATPAEIAGSVAFLANQDSGFITGQTLHVNGGIYFQ